LRHLLDVSALHPLCQLLVEILRDVG